jgi:penicillin amidase
VIGRIAALAGLAAALAAGAFFWWLTLSLPQADGERAVPGLRAAVEVVRDAHGVPHIRAANEHDAMFAMGYVHAQDRLWQMEMNRRTAWGTLSEALGAKALEADRFLRLLKLRQVAGQVLAKIAPEPRAALEAYAEGVNAFLAGSPWLPPEFVALGLRPEPWSALDSVGWSLVMAWELSANFRTEIARLRLAGTLDARQMQEFFSIEPGKVQPPLPDLPVFYGDALAGAPPAQVAAIETEIVPGSNNWVLSGARTASGKPMLANDPHLGLATPSVWYLAHVEAPGLTMVGATFPGLPLVAIGHNGRVAWGVTTTGGDVQDLYIEKLDASGTRYRTPEGWRDFEVREETIRIKGGGEEKLRVRETRHGPIVSGAYAPAEGLLAPGHVLALQWIVHTHPPRTIDAGYRLARAGNVAEVRAALASWDAPQQSFVFADVHGGTGFAAPGVIPVRRKDNAIEGRAPVPGWEARYDWVGEIAFAELPQVAGPELAVSANDDIRPPGYAPFLTHDWYAPFRSGRIRELLAATPKHDTASFARIQGDVLSPQARLALPHFRKALAVAPAVLRARAEAWNGEMGTDEVMPRVFAAWWRQLTRETYGPVLGRSFNALREQRAPLLLNAMDDVGGQSRWCRGDCEGAALRAMARALAEELADGWDRRRWGEVHAAAQPHRPFSAIDLLDRFFSARVESPGDGSTVDVGAFSIGNDKAPFENRHAAGLRMVCDLADLAACGFMISTGQSGHVRSPHYRDLAPQWARVEYFAIPLRAGAVDARHRLLLTP